MRSRWMSRAWRGLTAATSCALVGGLVGCGGERPPNADTTSAAASPPPAAASSTSAPPAAAPAAVGARPAAGAPPAGATAAMVALGDSVFHGEAAGGTCFTCHGADAKGTALAPPLVSHKWLTGDGSYAFIQQRVQQGMPSPTPPYAAPMPPMGGAQLKPEQVKAVAAYVYAISHP
jgi:mono/diheme cytochrome c family protein